MRRVGAGRVVHSKSLGSCPKAALACLGWRASAAGAATDLTHTTWCTTPTQGVSYMPVITNILSNKQGAGPNCRPSG